jgi:hypothetical protein
MNNLVQEVAIKADSVSTFEEIVRWQDGGWWPKVPMKFTRLTDNDGKPIYLQEAKVPFGPKWHTKIEPADYQQKTTRRYFLDGIFQGGREEITLEDTESGLLVKYNFYYQIKSRVGKFFWDKVFKRLHKKNIEKILTALKEHLEKRS